MIPSLINVLPYKTNSSSILRAEAIKFVACSSCSPKPIVEYCKSVSLNLLLQKNEKPQFPKINNKSYDTIEYNAFSSIDHVINTSKNAAAKEIEAALYFLEKAMEIEMIPIKNEDLDKIHKSVKHSKDPRLIKPYLRFLSSLGLHGIPYAAQISSCVQQIPFY